MDPTNYYKLPHSDQDIDPDIISILNGQLLLH